MKYLLFVVMLLLASCGSKVSEPDLYYKAEFDIALVDEVSTYFKTLAGKRDFEVFEKDRREMKAITQGREAFYISYYAGDKDVPVLWVTNAGAGTVIDLAFHANEGHPLYEVEKLSGLVLKDLKRIFGIDMVTAQAEKSSR